MPKSFSGVNPQTIPILHSALKKQNKALKYDLYKTQISQKENLSSLYQSGCFDLKRPIAKLCGDDRCWWTCWNKPGSYHLSDKAYAFFFAFIAHILQTHTSRITGVGLGCKYCCWTCRSKWRQWFLGHRGPSCQNSYRVPPSPLRSWTFSLFVQAYRPFLLHFTQGCR